MFCISPNKQSQRTDYAIKIIQPNKGNRAGSIRKGLFIQSLTNQQHDPFDYFLCLKLNLVVVSMSRNLSV